MNGYAYGTLIINTRRVAIIYIRGDAVKFDTWETLGSKGWNWDTLLPYFIRLENFTIPTDAQLGAGATFLSQYHREEGQLKTGFPYQLENGSFHNLARETCETLGFNVNRDLNKGKTHGYGAFPRTVDRDANVRKSSARAYYKPIDTRPNLHIIKGTARKITWSESHSTELVATGFEYVDNQGNLVKITAEKEVILSAGVLISPLILESSGVGNPT